MTPADKPDPDSTNKGAEPPAKVAPPAGKPEQPAPHPKNRSHRLIIFLVLFLVILAVAAAYFFRLDFPYRWTDDAYVHGNKVLLVPRVASTVVAINADDTDLVQKGQPVAQYQQTILVALQDVENALTAYAREQVRRE